MDNQQVNALIAEKIMGWEQRNYLGLWISDNGTLWITNDLRPRTPHKTFHPSTDISVAWEVVTALTERGVQVEIQNFDEVIDVGHWYVAVNGFFANADTVPLAICLAALGAVGVDVAKGT